MRKFNLVSFSVVVFSATSIGANNFYRFLDGKEPLSNRNQYCDFRELQLKGAYDSRDRSQSLLQGYLKENLEVTSLPPELEAHLQNEQELIESRYHQLEKSIGILKNQERHLAQKKIDKIKSWQSHSQSSLQIERLYQDLLRQGELLARWKKRILTEAELFESYLHVWHQNPNGLPYLGLQVDLQNSILPWSNRIFLKPVWVTKTESNSWIVQPASQNSLLEFSGTMVTAELKKAFETERLPASLNLYRESENFEIQKTQWQFLSENSLVLIREPQKSAELLPDEVPAIRPSHSFIRASLDLDCKVKKVASRN